MNPHLFHRNIAVRDMAMHLIVKTGEAMPRYSYRSVVNLALKFACEMNAAQWAQLGRDAGHYLAGGAPADETTAAVLAELEAMIPGRPALPAPKADADPFAGLPR